MSGNYLVKVVTNQREEEFNLENVPAEKTEIVKMCRNNLSAELNLNKLLVNLDNTADLLHIAHAALSGTKVQSQLSGLQNDLAVLCGDSQAAMQGIQASTQTVLLWLPQLYSYLADGEIDAAMEILSACSQEAGVMAETAQGLADRFDKMAEKAEKALEDSQDLYAEDEEKKRQIADQINQLKAANKGLEAESAVLKKNLDEIRTQYAQAQSKEEKAQSRAFTMGIISMCTSTLTLGLANVGAALASSKNDSSDKEKAEKEEEKSRLKTEEEENQEKLKEAEEKLKQAEEELKAKPDDAELKEAVEESKQEVADCKKKDKDISGKLKVVEAALQAINESLSQAKSAADQQLETAQKKTQALLEHQMELQKKEGEIAGQMAEMAMKIKDQKEVYASAETAVKMLQLAISCLNNIVVSLEDAAMFWLSIKQGCENLGKEGFIKIVQSMKLMKKEAQQKYFLGDPFKQQIIMYMATWVALHWISADYYEISLTVRNKVNTYRRTSLFEKDAFDEAKRMADQIISSMQQQQEEIAANQNRIAELKQKIQ